jgi:molecular chaperone GrpE
METTKNNKSAETTNLNDELKNEADIEEEVIGEEEISKKISDLEIKLENALKLAEERKDQLLRCGAELDNVQKRAERDKREVVKYATEKLIIKLLSVLDSLEQASSHDEGAKKIYQQLFDILKDEGLIPIPASGEKFDPYKHEALMQVKSEELDEDTVAEEFQRGYALSSKVIRFSKVAVVKR